MGARNVHLVARQTFELKVSGQDQARELNGSLPGLFGVRVAPLLQELFDRVASGGRHLRFDRVEIDLGRIPSADLDTELPRRLRDALAARMGEATAGGTAAPPSRPPQGEYPEQAESSLPETSSPGRPLPGRPSARAERDSLAASLADAPGAREGTLRRNTKPRVADRLARISGVSPQAEVPRRPLEALAGGLGSATAEDRPAPPSAPPQVEYPEQAELSVLATFLRTGLLPWWVTAPSQADMDAVARSLARRAPGALAAMLRRIMEPRVAQRLAAQLGPGTRLALLALLAASEVPSIEAVAERLIKRIEKARPKVAPPASSGSPEELAHRALFEALAIQEAQESVEAQVGEIIARFVDPMHETMPAPPATEAPARDLPPPAPAGMATAAPARPSAVRARESRRTRRLPNTTPGTREAPQAGEHQALRTAAPPSSAPGPRGRASTKAGGVKPEADSPLDRASSRAEGTPVHLDSGEAARPRETRVPDVGPLPEVAAGLFVENAGLVILWPFLARFLETLGLVAQGRFPTGSARERAALLLQHLAEGGSEWAEHRLALNKLLCGLPLDAPLPRAIELTEAERGECEALLASIIAHWKALKQTSVRGLREAFLLRAGILTRQAQGWKLEVARTGYDVLLDELPWGIGLVLLPWMEEPVFVQW